MAGFCQGFSFTRSSTSSNSHSPSPIQSCTYESSMQCECRVCGGEYSLEGEKVPRLLSCGHTACHECLVKLHTGTSTVSCPFDRQPTNTGDGGVWNLKKNFALIEILDGIYASRKAAEAASQPKLLDYQFLDRQKELAVPCDENEMHTAVLFCLTCETSLCRSCSDRVHSAGASRTLARHRRVLLSDRPRLLPRCPSHPMHIVEFACGEEECSGSAFMCYVCKDYGKHAGHKHVLLESEAGKLRQQLKGTLKSIRTFGTTIQEALTGMVHVISQIEGSSGSTPSDGQPLLPGSSETDRIGQVDVTATVEYGGGTAGAARTRVRQHFADLRETLRGQEIAASAVVDAHVREKLSLLQGHEHKMGDTLAYLAATFNSLQAMTNLDDSQVFRAQSMICELERAIQHQQEQFILLPQHLQADPAITITFTKDNRAHIGPKMEMRVVTLGLDGAGKTSILFRLKQDEFVSLPSTIGFNVETVEHGDLRLTLWDVGGLKKLRPLWKYYYFNTQAVVYVVDSSAPDRIEEAARELEKLAKEKDLREASVLILANKQDVQPCLTIEQITEKFNLFKLFCGRSWHIQACDARTGTGLSDAVEWLSRQLIATESRHT